MKLLIVDDEPLARLRLRTLVEALPDTGAAVAAEAGDTEQALAALKAHSIDAVLLDIQLPGKDGLRLAAVINALRPAPAVIFVTAHAEHALQAFELEAADYLTKPVRSERLRTALLRVRQRLQQAQQPAADAPALVVSDRGRVLRLPLTEVLLLKAELKYVTLRTAAHSYVLDEPLAELEQRLHALGGAFLRVHRNALVARSAIRALALRGADGGDDNHDGDSWAVRVAPLDEWLSVSRRQLAAVRAALAAAP